MKARQRHGSAEQALATAQQRIESSAAREDETTEQEVPESEKRHTQKSTTPNIFRVIGEREEHPNYPEYNLLGCRVLPQPLVK